MTLIITHANGFTSCFTRTEGNLKQRALIDTGDDGLTPEQLAEFGEELAAQYKWLGESSKGILAALPYSKPKPLALPKPNAEPMGDQRRAMIIQFLTDNPNSNMGEILAGLNQPHDPQLQSRWNSFLTGMVNKKLIKRKGTVRHYTYSIR